MIFLLEYCDYCCHNKDHDRIFRPNGLGSYLFLRFYYPMIIVLNNEIVRTKAGACILYTPECPQDYCAVKNFQNSYLQFDTEDDFFSDHQIPVNQVFYPHHLTDIDQLFSKLQNEFLGKENLKEQMIETIIKLLFIECHRQIHAVYETSDLEAVYDKFHKLRFEMLTQCEKHWTMEELYKNVHLEKSQFHNYYERLFNISPKADLINARMNKAKQLLSNNNAVIQEVAESCGFSNTSHFSRQFKRNVGCSPSEYRKNMINQSNLL